MEDFPREAAFVTFTHLGDLWTTLGKSNTRQRAVHQTQYDKSFAPLKPSKEQDYPQHPLTHRRKTTKFCVEKSTFIGDAIRFDSRTRKSNKSS
jgi:hypothetical protein